MNLMEFEVTTWNWKCFRLIWDLKWVLGSFDAMNLSFYVMRTCWAFQFVRNPSVSLSPTLVRNEKVEHYIRIKTHKPIALRFWVESGVSVLCG